MMGLGLGLNKHRKVGVSSSSTPGDIGTLVAWFDFRQGSVTDGSAGSISDGETVGTITDLSGNSHVLDTHSSVAAKPSWVESALNGYPGLEFTGGQKLNCSTIIVNQPYTVIIAGKNTSSSGYFFDGKNLASGNRGAFGRSGSNWIIFSGAVLLGATADADDHVLTTVFNATSSIIRMDGTQLTTGNAGSQDKNGLTLGGDVSGSTFLAGFIYEIAIWDGNLTGSDLTNAESYFQDKFGL